MRGGRGLLLFLVQGEGSHSTAPHAICPLIIFLIFFILCILHSSLTVPGLDARKGARLTDFHVYTLVHFVLLLNCELCKGKVGVVWAWSGCSPAWDMFDNVYNYFWCCLRGRITMMRLVNCLWLTVAIKKKKEAMWPYRLGNPSRQVRFFVRFFALGSFEGAHVYFGKLAW